MSVIGKYREFKDGLRNWVKVDLGQYRKILVPLRDKSPWGDVERKVVSAIAMAGGGYSLKKLYFKSKGEAEMAKIFQDAGMGKGPDNPEESPKDALEAHIKGMVKSCKIAGWTKANFQSFMLYLESNMTIDELHAALNAPKTSSVLFQAAAKKGAENKTNAAAETPPEEDLFAEKYRNGSFAYRRVVMDIFERASEECQDDIAPEESQNGAASGETDADGPEGKKAAPEPKKAKGAKSAARSKPERSGKASGTAQAVAIVSASTAETPP